MRALNTYEDEGQEAYLEGKSVDDCPYEEGKVRYFQWCSGYWDAQADDQFSLPEDHDPFDPGNSVDLARDDARSHKRSAELRILKAEALLPTIPQLEVVVGSTEVWGGNCYGIAEGLLNSGLLQALEGPFGTPKLCYGQYTGWIDRDSPFHGRGVARHAWLEFEEGIVIDPTYWVFTGDAPALRVAGVEEYDLANRRLRARVLGDHDAPEFSEEFGVVRWTINDPDVSIMLDAILGDKSRLKEGLLCRRQAHWIANRPLSELGENAANIYRAFEILGIAALIPIDNRNYVSGSVRQVMSGR